jgi:hypothetical protein
VTFESKSNLSRIEAVAFQECNALKFLTISASIRELCGGWAEESCLEEVTFESGRSLRTMIETGKIDLSRRFVIRIPNDEDVDVPGYYVDIDRGDGYITLKALSARPN